MYSKKSKNTGFDVNTFPFVGLSIFVITVLIFWHKVVAIFKPDTYENTYDKPVNNKVATLKASNYISSDGHFISGSGVKTKYTVGLAKSQAEQLAGILGTYKGASWYSNILTFSFSSKDERLKEILNPNYPSVMRKFVIESYRDIYTNKNTLSADVRGTLTGFAGTDLWTNDLTKYFTL